MPSPTMPLDPSIDRLRRSLLFGGSCLYIDSRMTSLLQWEVHPCFVAPALVVTSCAFQVHQRREKS
ncbi:hypothetical protein CFIMG_000595RAa [Ceratocystis fimbriata CBS 114723]|uniref:Uncharacterized protein n=1 Tax=Ceratocystis fimbriata CBS 114723 TaxID=1035309 RepID=A0A2C5X3J3_9PEZI|nr:hypothetical protein CFIMG_000595RAa [Ceratocystis fimbriata CBS 114723]